MRKKIILSTALLVLCCECLFAETAVIPYKIINSSVDFPESMGEEYSRLLSVAALIGKENIEIMSPREINADLERLKISPQEVITGDDLDLLGRTRHIDLFLSGSLSRKGGGFRSESILYSVRERKIIMRIRVEDQDLFKLAEKETREAFIQYRNREAPGEGEAAAAGMDAVFLLDTSYAVQHDWQSIKDAIVEFSSHCIDTLRLDTRIYIVPFSDRHAYAAGSVSINSIQNVRRELDNINPAGGASSENFIKSLQHAVQNVRWRTTALKRIVLVANSMVGPRAVDKYAVLARNKGISIVSVSLGQVAGDQCEAYERLSRITGGAHVHVAYHQKIFNEKGDPLELYLENGRLFKSPFPESSWRKGLYLKKQKGQGHEKPKPFAEEIYYSDKKTSVSPHTMAEAYARIAVERIINKENVESNTGTLLVSSVKTGGGRKNAGGIVGKALVSDGKISFWIYARDARCMADLEKGRNSGVYVPLGIYVKKDATEAYGVTLVPLVTNLSSDYIPEVMKAGLSDIIKQSDHYITRGLLYPPVWFVIVKVDTVERLGGGRDIRQK